MEGLDLSDGPGLDLVAVDLRQSHRLRLAGVGGDEPVVDRGVEHSGRVGEHGADVGRGDLALEAAEPRLDD